MMRVAFVLPELSHNAAIATSDVTGFVDEEDNFRLVSAQSCVAGLHLLERMCCLRLVSARQCVRSRCEGRVGGVI
jgi:hypothetical protein